MKGEIIMHPRKRLMFRRRDAARRAAVEAEAQPEVVELEPAVEEVVEKKAPAAKTRKAPVKKARKKTTQKK
tara:strand:+ start:379 stop:591 length:213 start_codon:yes stop_codon:yes gene_type:complete